HRAEEKLRGTEVKVTALRAAYFMENWAGVLAPMKNDGVLPSMLTPGRATSMVATADIGRVAAQALLSGESAPQLIELAGPRDYAPEEVAAAFGNAVGRKIQVVEVPDAAIEPALAQAGLKPKLAKLFREMDGALNRGTIRWTGSPTRGKVGVEEVAAQIAR